MELLSENNTIDKKYFTIGEVAELLQVNPSLIRFWESEFSMLQFKKNKKGERRFTQEDISALKMIYYLVKQQGYTLEGAKEAIRQRASMIQNKLKAIESLQKVKSFLVILKGELPE